MKLVPKHKFDFGTDGHGDRIAWADSLTSVETCCRNVRQLSTRGATGYYADEYCEQLYSAYIGQLPAARGGSVRFVAIVEDVDYGSWRIELSTFDDEIGAWHRALQLAERIAQEQSEANAEFQAECEAEERESEATRALCSIIS